jgi:hypothetical protein
MLDLLQARERRNAAGLEIQRVCDSSSSTGPANVRFQLFSPNTTAGLYDWPFGLSFAPFCGRPQWSAAVDATGPV